MNFLVFLKSFWFKKPINSVTLRLKSVGDSMIDPLNYWDERKRDNKFVICNAKNNCHNIVLVVVPQYTKK